MITNPLLNNGQLQASDPTTYTNNVIQTIFSLLLIVAVVYFIFNIIMASIKFIGSNGDQKKVETAKTQITYTFIGLLIVFCLFAVLKLIGVVTGLTGLENLQIPWPSL